MPKALKLDLKAMLMLRCGKKSCGAKEQFETLLRNFVLSPFA
jgi:hypothetical protein